MRLCSSVFALLCALASVAFAQGPRPQLSPEETKALIEKRESIEKQLEDIAIIGRKVMVPMKDGARMAADIYRPNDTSKKYPIIFSRTPYNFNFWDVRLGTYRDMSTELDAVKRGYVLVEMNERGHFFSEGNYDILGAPLSDANDQFNWMSAQPWSSGKIGLIGCSSTAEWQLAAASLGNKALTTIIPQSFGAGVGKVGPYNEQGNWYRGGAVQMLFIDWVYGEQNQVRPMFPKNTSQADLIKASKMFDLAPQMPPIDWAKAFEHLPETELISNIDGPKGIFADKMRNTTGGAMIERTPNDPAWRKGGIWQSDTMPINVPGFWFMTWYDVSTGPNLAAYNFVRDTAKGEAKNEQYAVIAATLHCQYKRASEHTVVGERDMGDVRLDWDGMTYGWFDRFLKGEDNGILKKTPHVQYYTMGLNKWQSSETWPPYGGNVRCTGDAIPGNGGALDQRKMEDRPEILVYSSEPLKEGVEVDGPIDATLYVSSDVKDTDVTVKLIDVQPDGTAYNLDETI